MHKSRLAGFIIDCETQDLEAAADFWSQALGCPRLPQDPDDAQYVELDPGVERLHIEVQRVTHASRVHLDIETDDIDKEVRRLEGLGAKRIEQVRTWWVMEAPTGQRFCVIRSQKPDFDRTANRWE